MKKTLVLFLVVVFLATGCTTKKQENNNDSNLSPEVDINNGSAKAIEDETDLWIYYENEEAEFSIKYPHNISMDIEDQVDFYLSITNQDVESLEGTMGYNKETAEKNVKSLENGEYGEGVDFPLEVSKKVREIMGVNAQEFMVLGRFEICDLRLERKLYFFNNDQQIVITLIVAKDNIISDHPEYLTVNEDNCGKDMIWDFEKQDQFYQNLEEGNLSGLTQEWFDVFDEIVDTIEFIDNSSSEFSLIQGKWSSVGDNDSIIEFDGDAKVDYYRDQKLLEGKFKITDNLLTVTIDGDTYKYTILNVSDSDLSLSYLPRGNTLDYKRVE
jgi:hypothetical protein